MVYNKGKTRETFIPDSLIRELEEYCETENIKSGVLFITIDIHKLLR